MQETDRERILRLVAEGVLRPDEAARMIEALNRAQAQAAQTNGAEKNAGAAASPAEKSPLEKEKSASQSPKTGRPPLQTVEIQRPDGSRYTLEVPPGLVPAFMRLAGVYVKEQARTATQEAWGGLKVMVKRSFREMKTNLRSRVGGTPQKKEEAVGPSPKELQKREERLRLLRMVEMGRLKAEEAERIWEQLDALHSEQKA